MLSPGLRSRTGLCFLQSTDFRVNSSQHFVYSKDQGDLTQLSVFREVGHAMTSFRSRLKHRELALRLARSNRSQNHWALRLGLDKGHLSKMLRGKRPFPNALTRRKLLEGLGLEFDDLFELISEGQPESRGRQNSQDRSRSHPGWSLERLDTESIDGGRHPMLSIFEDIPRGFRNLTRNPGFALIIVLTLALGIGANTAIFTLVRGVLLHPLPFPESDRIMTLWQSSPQTGIEKGHVSFANAMDWRRSSQSFEAMAVAEPYSFEFHSEQEPRVFPASLVSDDFFASGKLLHCTEGSCKPRTSFPEKAVS